MLKGKTVIELTNVKTGQVERYEDENIVTNALQEYMNALCLICSVTDFNSQLPMYKNALGGIRLYETALEESVTNVLMPSVGASKIVGYASYTVKTNADARRGNLNQQETTVLDNGVQLVWDFATSETNGTIACVCLTPKENGEDSFAPIRGGANYSYSTNYLPRRNLFGIDEENGWLYCHDGSKALKCKFSANNIGLVKNDATTFEVIEVIGEWNFSFSSYNPYRLLDANTIHYITNEYSRPNILVESRMNLQTGEATTINHTIPNASFLSGVLSYNVAGYTLFPHKSEKKIYKVNLADTSDVTLLEIPNLVTSGYNENETDSIVYRLANGDVMYGNAVIDVTTGTYDTIFTPVTYRQKSPTDLMYKGYKFLGCRPKTSDPSYGSMFTVADVERLMTINNLQTPVTKTADKTMKITYTLLEVDE